MNTKATIKPLNTDLLAAYNLWQVMMIQGVVIGGLNYWQAYRNTMQFIAFCRRDRTPDQAFIMMRSMTNASIAALKVASGGKI